MHTITIIMVFCCLKYSCGSGLTATELVSFTNGVVVDSSTNATYYKISATGLPDHSTYKVNPNDASIQNHEIWVKKNPTFAQKTYCLPLGQIGLGINGVSLFNPLTINGHNAVEGENKEIFDSCNGHPAEPGEYHYHQLPNCTYNGTSDEFIGVALDGFPIYGPNVSDLGREITTSELDECHGRTSVIKGVSAYRYFITRQYPYILGCFKGEIVQSQSVNTFNASYVCPTNVTACNCPIMRRGMRPKRPGGGAGCNMSNLFLISAVFAYAAYLIEIP